MVQIGLYSNEDGKEKGSRCIRKKERKRERQETTLYVEA